MNKKRLLAAALLLSMPLLSGCSSMVSERAMEDISALTIEAGAEAPMEDEFADETRRVAFFYLLWPRSCRNNGYHAAGKLPKGAG